MVHCCYEAFKYTYCDTFHIMKTEPCFKDLKVVALMACSIITCNILLASCNLSTQPKLYGYHKTNVNKKNK